MATDIPLWGEDCQPILPQIGERRDEANWGNVPSMGTSLRKLRLAKGWTHDEAAAAMGLSRGQFIKLERGERGLTERTIELASKAFSVPRAAIVEEAGPAEAEPAATVELTPSSVRFIDVPVIGVVEAGAFRMNEDIYQDEPVMLSVPVDPDFPHARITAWDVAGDSMNALKPRPIFPGDRVIGINFEDLDNRVPLRDGMVVVVEQTRDGGHIREWSVKQIELYDDRVEFHPRSTNARHKPIVIKRDLWADDGREVSILAIVRRVTNEFSW
ncbi:XRE family transcriptional regulator [Aquabacter sp. CN5-332]|uniref:helix-turn-helix domain-containing protein n=1 Tax=Aquabacter sp. CN5-332 TaxID=3156608 RepID=UPI0032B5818B